MQFCTVCTKTTFSSLVALVWDNLTEISTHKSAYKWEFLWCLFHMQHVKLNYCIVKFKTLQRQVSVCFLREKQEEQFSWSALIWRVNESPRSIDTHINIHNLLANLKLYIVAGQMADITWWIPMNNNKCVLLLFKRICRRIPLIAIQPFILFSKVFPLSLWSFQII